MTTKPKTHNDNVMDQLAKYFELALKISDKQDTLMVKSTPESSDREVSSQLGETQMKPFEETTSESDYSNDNQEAQSNQGCSTQQQVKRSICQADIPGIVGVTEIKLKRCDKLHKLVAIKRNLAKGLMKTFATNNKRFKRNEGLTEIDETHHTKRRKQQFKSTAIKRSRDSPSKTQQKEESSRFFKFRKCMFDENNTCTQNDAEWITLNNKTKSASQREIENTRKIILYLEEELKQTEEKLNALSPSISATTSPRQQRCKEPEEAYKDFEDYWQDENAANRILFEEERQIYKEEQQESGKEFNEFLEIESQYEKQLSKDGCLSFIEEKYVLEQLYADLETESEEIRENDKKFKSQEIEALESEIEDLHLLLSVYIKGQLQVHKCT